MASRLGFAYSIPIGTTSAVNARVTPFGIFEIRVASTADCYVTIGSSPVATVAGSTLVRASVAGEVFTITAGEQIACIAGTSGGTLNITEMTL